MTGATPYYASPSGDVVLYRGDAAAVLRALPAGSVHCCITSPPYFSLRDYGTGTWGGGDESCDHARFLGGNGAASAKQVTSAGTQKYQYRAVCGKCGARRVDAQIGLEESPEAYVAALVAVFREVRRVLHPTGTVWCNIGDGYGNERSWGGKSGAKNAGSDAGGYPRHKVGPGLGNKQLLMMPSRVAIALQADGWLLRSMIPYLKRNAMPECLDPGTFVYVLNDRDEVQRVTLEEIVEAGDPYPRILGPYGWRRIRHAWEVEKPEAVIFDAAKVSTITCSPEHRWPVSHDRRRLVVREKATCELRDTGYNDYLLHFPIDQYLPDAPTSIGGQPMDYELGWLVGLYAAEGGFGELRGHRCKFTLHRDEAEITASLGAIVHRKFGAVVSERVIGNYRQVRFSDPRWHDIATELVPGLSTTKAVNLARLLNAPREFRLGVWEGYIEGDGSRRGHTVVAVSASKALRDSMAVVASAVGIITSKGERHPRDPRTGKTYDGYHLATPYAKHRQPKAAVGQVVSRQVPVRKKRIIPGPHRMIDLEVDDGLFLIDDGLLTHNSATDRPTTATEYVFLLAKSERYFYDATAVAVRATQPLGTPALTGQHKRGVLQDLSASTLGTNQGAGARNRRNADWWFDSLRAILDGATGLLADEDGAPLALPVNPQPFPGSHFAVFPERLVEPMLLSSTSARGACPACLAPYVRTTTVEYDNPGNRTTNGPRSLDRRHETAGFPVRLEKRVETTGWRAGCGCADAGDPTPAVVLDPFAGSGTVGVVARKHGRHFIGVDLSAAYLAMARERLGQLALPFGSGAAAGG